MDLEKAVRERLIAELQKADHSQTLEPTPRTTSIGVITDECNKDNGLVREGIVRELTKSSNKVISCNVKDASSQTYTDRGKTNNNKQVDGNLEQRLIDIERECEQRMRKELNEQLRISAKKHAIEAVSRTRRKHKEECRLLQNQIRGLEQSLESERLERATVNSELELLSQRMRQCRDKQFCENQKIESELRNATRERDKYKLMTANLQDTHNDMEKKLKELKTAKEKAVSALEQKTSEATALRSLLKQCQSALESVSFRPTTIDEDPIHSCRREDHGYVAATKPKPIVTPVDNGINSIEKELTSTLKDPPCTSTKDPPTEELLPSVRSLDYTSSSIDSFVPHEIGVDLYSNHNSSENAPLPMQELQLNVANSSHKVGGADAERDEPAKPEPSEIQNDEEKLSVETSHTTTKTPTKGEIPTTAEEEPIELQKSSSSSSSRINNSMESESTNGTDDYSMSFHSLKSHKRDEKGRVQYLHIL
jgi:hypothetical protein